HRHVAQEGHLENAAAAEGREPEPAREIPIGPREILGVEAAAFLQHEDAVALFRKAKPADAAPKAGADDGVIPLHEIALLSVKEPCEAGLLSGTSCRVLPVCRSGSDGRPIQGTGQGEAHEIWTIPSCSSESEEAVAPGVSGSILGTDSS